MNQEWASKEVWLRYQYEELQRSAPKIARKLGCTSTTVYKWMGRLHILVRSLSESAIIARSNHVNLTSEASEFIAGLMLGDGHLDRHKWSSAYCDSSKSKGYLEWLSKELAHFGIEQCGRIKRQEKDTHFPDRVQRTVAFHYNSRCYIELKALRSKWYRPTKIVPENLQLTPLVCRMWYLGDGGLSFTDYSVRVCFATQSFIPKEIDFLIYLLRRLGLKAARWKDKTLSISAKNTKDFFDYIGPCPEEIKSIYGYKWAYPSPARMCA